MIGACRCCRTGLLRTHNTAQPSLNFINVLYHHQHSCVVIEAFGDWPGATSQRSLIVLQSPLCCPLHNIRTKYVVFFRDLESFWIIHLATAAAADFSKNTGLKMVVTRDLLAPPQTDRVRNIAMNCGRMLPVVLLPLLTGGQHSALGANEASLRN